MYNSVCGPVRSRRWGMMALLAVAAILSSAVKPARADLKSYVERPDAAYSWKLKGKSELPLGTIYDLQLVSQEWQGIRWEHGLQVYLPRGVSPTKTLFLWNQGGKPSLGSAAFGLELGRKMNAPCVFLFGIPNQPLLEGKKEDDLISETFLRYLRTSDENWPLLFPMVKSLVKAMDALQEFAKEEWKQPVTGFVVSGASKRGWTTWLTGVADSRVKAIAPLVIDTLNMVEQMEYQRKSFGEYSEQIADYTRKGLVPIPDTTTARKLWRMVDPYSYREELKIPKLLINGNNDPYWTVDALNLYWDGLGGPKWVMYVPNAGHNLEQRVEDKPDRTRAVNGLAAFGRHMIHGLPMPEVKWKHESVGENARLVVETSTPPKAARLWICDGPTRDFRKATWKSGAVKTDGDRVIGVCPIPGEGCRAFYAEVEYEVGGYPFQLSTQIRVLGSPR